MKPFLPLILAALIAAAPPLSAQETQPSVTAAVTEAEDAAAQLRAAVEKLADAGPPASPARALPGVSRAL